MAFIPSSYLPRFPTDGSEKRTWNDWRDQFLNDPANGPRASAPGFLSGATGGASSVGGSAAPPSTPAGGRFAALRGFFEANQPAANTAATAMAQPIEARAQEAVTKADESSRLPENYGGREAAETATRARNDALGQVRALGSQAGVEGLLGTAKRDANYSPGMRAADAYLYGRSPAFGALRQWEPVLSALEPTYRPPHLDSQASPAPPRPTTGNPQSPYYWSGRDSAPTDLAPGQQPIPVDPTFAPMGLTPEEYADQFNDPTFAPMGG